MLASLLPAEVESAEAFADSGEAVVFAQERELIANAVERRRREFATGRACARTALASLGAPPGPITRDRHGAPRWPRGVVGSITHCDGYRGSAVAWSTAAESIGIDAEPNAPLPSRVLGSIATQKEVSDLRLLPASGICWDRLLFSAKESAYKAWYPLAGERLGFGNAIIGFDPGGRFSVRLTPPQPGERAEVPLEGRWLCARGLLLTAIVTAPAAIRAHSVGRS